MSEQDEFNTISLSPACQRTFSWCWKMTIPVELLHYSVILESIQKLRWRSEGLSSRITSHLWDVTVVLILLSCCSYNLLLAKKLVVFCFAWKKRCWMIQKVHQQSKIGLFHTVRAWEARGLFQYKIPRVTWPFGSNIALKAIVNRAFPKTCSSSIDNVEITGGEIIAHNIPFETYPRGRNNKEFFDRRIIQHL